MFDRAPKFLSVRNTALFLLLGAAIYGCTVGPDYRRPDIDVPAGWRLESTQAEPIYNDAWWDHVQDPALSGLVRTALVNNKDLKIATANVAQAAAQYGIVRSAQLPQVDANASAARQGVSRTLAVKVPAGSQVFNSYGVNLSASFE